MAGMEQPPDEVLDLLVKELTEGLSADEHRVLAAAAPQATNDYRRGLERTAAAINLAAASTDSEPLPAVLRARLEHEAQVYFSARVAPAANEPSPAPAAAKPGIGRGPAGGWWAAAACLLLALFAWNRSPKTGATPVETARRETPVPEPTPQMQRAALIARADTLKIPLGATKDPAAAGVSGDVVWDGRAQRGYLRLVGLRHNDPSVQQYQMWIFDGDRDAR